MNISEKNLPEIRWHRPYRAVFFTEVGIRRDVATNTQPSCLVLYHLSLSPYHWRDVFSPVVLPLTVFFPQDIAATDNIYFEKWPAHASRPSEQREREKNSLRFHGAERNDLFRRCECVLGEIISSTRFG